MCRTLAADLRNSSRTRVLRHLIRFPPLKEDIEAADQRVMNDPSLQRGDIIATSKGFLMFVGRDNDKREAEDFLPAPAGLPPIKLLAPER